ncbi:MAG TPA: hypothetical protein VGK67_26905 [Myxococcales bacterium]|jgi:hypothetical protein
MTEPERPTCPKCGSPREQGPVCPRCGVIYAKAAARASAQAQAQRPAAPSAPAEPALPVIPLSASEAEAPGTTAAPASTVLAEVSPFWELDPDQAELEWKLRAAAVPAALLLARLWMETGMGRSLGRIFFSMWLHELGHAIASWLTGFSAVPLPWLTRTAESRSLIVFLLFAAAFGGLGWWGFKGGRRAVVALAGSLLLVQIVGTVALSVRRAQEIMIFAGDAGCFVLGTLLVASFLVPATRRGALRWGFLTIGAVAFMDPFEQWWAARTDVDRIPFGENEGVTLSDATKLLETYGWPVRSITRGYLTVAFICLVLLAAFWAWSVWHARRQARPA